MGNNKSRGQPLARLPFCCGCVLVCVSGEISADLCAYTILNAEKSVVLLAQRYIR